MEHSISTEVLGILLHWSKQTRYAVAISFYSSSNIKWDHLLKAGLGPVFLPKMIDNIVKYQSMKRI